MRGAIDSGVYHPGDQLPSTKELSKQLEVSLVTVHRALQELVSSGVLRRGQGRGTYVHEEYGHRSEIAAGLRFGLVFHRESSLADQFHGTILEGVRQAGDELGVDLVLLRFSEDWRNECQGYLYVNPFESQLDRPPRFAGRLRGKPGSKGASPQPIMVVGASYDKPGVSCIDTDNRDLARQAVEHLYQLGHQRIAFVGGKGEVSNDRDRWAGFRDTCARLGVSIDPSHVVDCTSYRVDDAHKQQLGGVLTSPRRPTAVFAAGYYFALDVYDAASRAGLKIPTDLSVIGVDDPTSASHLTPGLTTMRQPLLAMGRQAAKGLFEQIGDEHPAMQRTLLTAELVNRHSTAPISALKV